MHAIIFLFVFWRSSYFRYCLRICESLKKNIRELPTWGKLETQTAVQTHSVFFWNEITKSKYRKFRPNYQSLWVILCSPIFFFLCWRKTCLFSLVFLILIDESKAIYWIYLIILICSPKLYKGEARNFNEKSLETATYYLLGLPSQIGKYFEVFFKFFFLQLYCNSIILLEHSQILKHGTEIKITDSMLITFH